MTAFILVPKEILGTIRTERERYLPNETGGFLIGIRRGPHIEVTGITRQGPADVAMTNSFERRCASHRKKIHEAWQGSAGMESVIGDWHTHPTGTAKASSMDRGAWRTLVATWKRPVVGIVDAGASLPSLYFAARHQRAFGTELVLEQEAADHFAFAVSQART